MQERTLIEKEDVEIQGKKYFISAIPAVQAQKMFITGMSIFQSKNFAMLPQALVDEILSYCGTYNETGAEVQFVNSDIANMFIKDMFVLLKLEIEFIKKNFSFLFDGRAAELASQFGAALPESV